MYVYSLDGVESDDADRFLYLNRELLTLGSKTAVPLCNARMARGRRRSRDLRGLIPADERRQLVEQVGVGFFCQPAFGEFQETAVGVG